MGLRDRALLLVAYDTMCRRGELIKLRVEDIDIQTIDRKKNIGPTVIFIEQSKTDQEGHGRWLRISKEAAESLRIWLCRSGIHEGFIFRGITRANRIKERLTSGQVCRIYKQIARKAGVNEEFIVAASV